MMCGGYKPCYIPKKRGFLARARTIFKKMYPKVHKCAICGVFRIKYMEIHHIDHDFTNNDIDNLEMLCKSCHLEVHA